MNRQQANSTGKPKVYCKSCFPLHLRQLNNQDANTGEQVRSLDALAAHRASELMVDGDASDLSIVWDKRKRHDNDPMGWIRGESGTLLNHLRGCGHQPGDVQARAEAERLNRKGKWQRVGPPIIATPVTQDGTTIVPPLGPTQGVQPHGNTSLPLSLVDQQIIPPGSVPSWISVGDVLRFSLPPSLLSPSAPRPLHVSLPSMNPEYFQVSDTTSSELDLSLCVFPILSCNN